MIINQLRRAACLRIIITAVLVVGILFAPQTRATITNPQPGQDISIEVAGSLMPFTSHLMSAQGLSGDILTASVFGRTYQINIAGAALVDLSGSPITRTTLAAAQNVNVFGTFQPSSSLSVTGQRIQVVSGGSTPPGNDDGEGGLLDDDIDSVTSSGSSGGACTGPCQLLEALYQHVVTGRDIQSAEGDRGPAIERWNSFGGSQNLSLVARAASGDYQYLEDLANFSKMPTGGIYNRELGSPIFYFDAPMAALVVALRDARAAGDTAAVNSISGYMRATWALWSLVTVPANRSSGWLNLNGQVLTTNSGAYPLQNTPNVAAAGERFGTHWNGEPQPEIYSEALSGFVSWALDLPRGNWTNLGNNNHWTSGIVGRVANVTSYNQTTAPEIWGLSAADRTLFREIVNGNRSRLGEVLNIIKEYGVWNHVIRIRRTSNGAEMINFKSLNGNKPTQAATIVTNNGAWKGIRPCLSNVSSNHGYRVSVSNGNIIATGASPDCATVSMPELDGNLIYSLVLSGNQAYEGNITSPDGAITPPPGGGPPPPPSGLGTYNLHVTKSGEGSGKVFGDPEGNGPDDITCGSNCDALFDSGTSVTLAASPLLGSYFLGWTGCQTTSDINITVTMNAATTCNAQFEVTPDPYE